MQPGASFKVKAGLLNIIATIISKVLNPFGVSVIVLLSATFVGSSSLLIFFKWVSIIICFTVVLPLGYTYVKSPRVGSGTKQIQDPLQFFRTHRREISVVGIVCALPCILLLIFLNAPALLIATLVALLGTSLAVGLVNLFYKASYHLALITTVVIVAVIIWGRSFPYVLAVIPLVGWARYLLQQHSPGQLAAGFSLSVVVGAATIYLFGLMESIISL